MNATDSTSTTTAPAVAGKLETPVRPQPPAGMSECCMCGFRWRTGQHGGHSCAQQLREELDVTDKLLAERTRLLQSIPWCEHHGDQCVPHAMEWVRSSIRLRELMPRLISEAMSASAAVRDIDVIDEVRALLGPNAPVKPGPTQLDLGLTGC